VSGRRAWTDAEIIALGVKASVAQVASIVGLGGKGKAYRLLKEGRFPFPTYEVEGRTWVLMRPVREFMGIDPTPASAEGAPTKAPPAESSTAKEADDHVNQGNRRFRAV
jgi:hypothetical protein